MYPRLIETSFLTLHTFGVLLAAAYLTALWLVSRSARREGLNPERLLSLGLWCIGGALVGAKALLVIRSLPEYLADPSQLWSPSFLTSAGDFYGGFLGALLAAGIFFARHRDLPFWRAADVYAPAIALGQAIGRVGCLLAGDDYGRPTSLPWAVTFTDPDAARVGGAPLGIPLHPVQLYESLACLGLFFALLWWRRRRRFAGKIFLAYSVLYAVARFLLEYLRGDEDRGFLFGGLLSTSQFIALFVGLAASALIFTRARGGGRTPAAA
jgi:phosphatidylglycerol---prolipoprotein diacylglyceryl transferase